MNILMLNPFFYPYMGGTEKVIQHLGKRLSGKHNITVLAASHDNAAARETVDGIEVIRSPARMLYQSIPPLPPPIPLFANYPQDIKKQAADSDVLHIHNRFLIAPAYLGAVKDTKKPLMLTIHNTRPHGIDRLTDTAGAIYDDLFGHPLMRACAGITGVSRNALQLTVPKDYAGKTAVIHNGVDEHAFRPGKSGYWPDYFRKNGVERRTVFTNARLIPQKGIGYLIEAMKGVDADLVIFGRGPLKGSLAAKARSLGVNALFITQRIEEGELVALLNAVDIFVLPSLFEPCAVALLEAMGAGKPIVATAVGGNTELLEDGKSGILVPPRSPQAIASAVRTLLEDEALARQMGAEARKRVLKSFTWDITASKFDEFYSGLQ